VRVSSKYVTKRKFRPYGYKGLYRRLRDVRADLLSERTIEAILEEIRNARVIR